MGQENPVKWYNKPQKNATHRAEFQPASHREGERVPILPKWKVKQTCEHPSDGIINGIASQKARFGLKEKIRDWSASKVVETRQGGKAFSPIQKRRRVNMRR